MSGDQLDNIIKYSKGDISKIEDSLGFDRGYLGDDPVIVEINKPTGLRMPKGNELGAFRNIGFPEGIQLEESKRQLLILHRLVHIHINICFSIKRRKHYGKNYGKRRNRVI